jgi:GT2 family glycosyltransferase
MRLSVIIVNYNVKYFLEQALFSVRKACSKIEAEIIVVDNNSVDGSVEMLAERFPDVKVIANKINHGFSYANNQAIKQAEGDYILLLNPDTVVEEDTFEKTLQFMDMHPEAGGLGVKMIDGSGKFLPESKRGLPSPLVAFYKVFGFSAFFPKSKIFGKYHLGYLDKEKIHEVEILSGACMLIRKTVLNKIGLLDEAFFMYGEDIDLSYRIILAGYKNYYFPEARIIHYKGESTKKSSINYVFVFYNAMIIFAQKHFSQKNARLFSFLIHIAIYIRAGFALLTRILRMSFLPLIDFVFAFLGVLLLKSYWETHVVFSQGLHYPAEFVRIVIPVYILTWQLAIFLSGGYDKPIHVAKIIRGILSGTVLILIVYALLPETFRFSRALILLGAGWTSLSVVLTRLFFQLIKIKEYGLYTNTRKRVVIAGELEDGNRVLSLMNQTNNNFLLIGFINPCISGKNPGSNFLGTLDQLAEIVTVHKIDEVIFCSRDISAQHIIDTMSRISSKQPEYKIAPPESLFIIGSNSVNGTGDLYILDINTITKPKNQRNKRITDLAVCLALLITLPLCLIFIKNFISFLKNLLLILLGRKSWVGYIEMKTKPQHYMQLPQIKKGILSPAYSFQHKQLNTMDILNLNMLYAKDYKVMNDLSIIFKGYKHLGTSPNNGDKSA